MQKHLQIILTLLAVVFFTTCKKDPDVNIQNFEISRELITAETSSVSITGTYSYPGKIDEIYLSVGTRTDFKDAVTQPLDIDGNDFTVTVDGLQGNTMYNYRYEVYYGASHPFITETSTFQTKEVCLPSVSTATVSFIGPHNAICGGSVSDDGGAAVTARGICWSTESGPTLSNAHTVDSCGMGDFTSQMTGLLIRTKYYVRAYATNSQGTSYGSEESFTTATLSPTVLTVEVTAVDSVSARIKGNVTDDGGEEVTERGFCWSAYFEEPSLDDEHIAVGSGSGTFNHKLTGLTPNTTYHIRAYAKNETGLGFGEVLTFTTGISILKPSVSTVEINDVTATSAVCVGNVSSDGGSEVTVRGACWSTSQNPTISSSHLASGSGTGSYSVNIVGLSANKTYYVRAYAKNVKGVSYGEQKTITTQEGLPVVTTSSVSDITATSAKCGGNVTEQGASNVTERGICWSTSHNPTISGNHVNSGTGAGTFTCTMTGLTPNSTYYVKAYAKNAQGISYGSEESFVALEGLPVVVTSNVTDITATTAKCGGNVTDQGGSAVTERGICWSTSHNPTITDAHANSGAGAGSYTCTMTGLVNGVTYHVRAYAKNTQGTTYGEEKTFTTTVNKPSVTTSSVTNITQTTAVGGGNVTNSGGASVTERGICWSTSHNPTISNSHVANGTGTGNYTCNMSGLSSGTMYYVRAYATNSAGTSYGNEVSFTTAASLPVVTTNQVSNITQTSAQGSGNVTSDGGANVTERGICWSTSQNPTTSGSHASNGTGTGSYTVNMSGLSANTTYYVRAYAVNSQGTSYGNQVSFTTSNNVSAPIVTTSAVTNITQTTATGGGNVTNSGGTNVTERGVCWSTSHNPTINGTHANSGTGTGTYTVQMTGLTKNTTYFVRAYAVNSQGASYGDEVSFTTLPDLPTVLTSEVMNITQTTATGCGNVSGDGGGTVTERGICWSTSQNPTVSGSHGNSGTGTGSFTVNMAGLTPGTLYYVRAYAVNAAGTAYGSQTTFSTASNVVLPTVTTSSVTNITQTSAQSGGNVTSDGGGTVTGRGVCWSTNHNPTTSDNHTFDSYGTGSFTSSITGLTAGTTYYVRAYATNGAGTAYGNEVNFTTETGSGSYENGILPGLFSISATKQVHFSQGNLQYQASTNTWKFADHQWDYVGSQVVSYGMTGGNVSGSSNHLISATYDGWIDLFGWGTSGFHNPNDSNNVNYQPWSTSNSTVNTYYNYYGYGPSTNMDDPNLVVSSANYDWGIYNAISNGGNQINQWRVLSGTNSGEWYYLLNERSTSSGIRFAKACINGVNGIVLFPDNWIASSFSFNNTNSSNATFSSNEIASSVWTATLEPLGCVFLPITGCRYANGVNLIGVNGMYWTSNNNGSGGAMFLNFDNNSMIPGGSNGQGSRCDGLAVRLVYDHTYTISASSNPTQSGNVTGAGNYTQGATCTLTATANSGYRFVNWTENGTQVSTNATYSFPVNGNRTLVANFETISMYDNLPSFQYDGNTYKVYPDLGQTMNWQWANTNCDTITCGGFDDWRLPNTDELRKMYELKESIGSFADEAYWSSDKLGSNVACFIDFRTGYLGNYDIYNHYARVRPIRKVN